jgi:hypothetical protein
MDIDEIQGALRSLPRIKPDSAWKEQTRRRLFDMGASRPAVDWSSMTRWAVFATQTEDNLPVFAANVRAAGNGWKPVVVEPLRLGTTVRAIQPGAVVIDASLSQARALAAEVRAASQVEPLVMYPAELPQLKRKIA